MKTATRTAKARRKGGGKSKAGAAKDLYKAGREPEIVDVAKGTFLCVEGVGAPGGDAFSAAFGPLYGVAYTVKMTRKFGGGVDFAMGKIEAQWWGQNDELDFSNLPPESWRWRIMIRVADGVTEAEVSRARKTLEERGKGAGVDTVLRVVFREGWCVQAMHVGPYATETETIERMREHVCAKGYVLSGRHHEIYLSDPRRMAPERLKTILRIPVKKA